MSDRFNYLKSKIVVDKGWKFMLKEQNGIYYLIIPSTIGVGSDIIHKFSREDREKYDESGEDYIDILIEKMRKNPKDFEIRSWR